MIKAVPIKFTQCLQLKSTLLNTQKAVPKLNNYLINFTQKAVPKIKPRSISWRSKLNGAIIAENRLKYRNKKLVARALPDPLLEPSFFPFFSC